MLRRLRSQSRMLLRRWLDPFRGGAVAPHVKRLNDLVATDPQLKALMPSPAVRAAAERPGLSYARVIATIIAGYENRPALAQRSYDIVSDPATGRRIRHYLPAFSSISYGELQRRVEALASAWKCHPLHAVASGDFVCIVGFTGIDFTVVELACAYVEAVAVPLQSTMGAASLAKIFRDTCPAALVATTADLLEAVALAIADDRVRSIVVIDFEGRDENDGTLLAEAREKIVHAGCKANLVTCDELIAFGTGLTRAPPPCERSPERVTALIYTSGSTGEPKGALMPERASVRLWTQNSARLPRITVAYLPMNHLVGRGTVFSTLAQGGTVYFSLRPDMSSLLEDVRLARPTTLFFIPRLGQTIYQHYRSEIARRGDDPAAAARVQQEMRLTYLGDRLCGGTTGGAPTAPAVLEFLGRCFGIDLTETYGCTEAGGITARHRIVGGNVIDYRLRDIAELGYRRTDKPFPRGELLIKTKSQVLGYFKDAEATAALFDDGYVATGDIVAERGPGRLVWLDRRNEVLKLSQGEFVSIARLEALFEQGSALVKQIFLHGDPLRSYLLAVIVPDEDAIRARLGRAPDDRELKNLLRDALREAGRAGHLRPFELPRDFVIEPEAFSADNVLLSGMGKLLRPNLRRRYGPALDRLHAEFERRQQAALASARDGGRNATALGKLCAALEATIGIDIADIGPEESFFALGGDSLGALSLSHYLEQVFGLALPIEAILDPRGSVKRWAAEIDKCRRRGDGPTTPDFARIHGARARLVRASDFRLAAFMDLPAPDKASPIIPAGANPAVLLTGATGHLGRFLCLEWLERMAQNGGKLICLVRADDDARAAGRLEEVFDRADPAMRTRFRALSNTHLDVVAGDTKNIRLGLSADTYDRLAKDVGHVVHAAALVNHLLPYRELFTPNVAGTANVIRFALTRRHKRFDFISSAAVASMVSGPAPPREDADLAPTVTLRRDYASGYAASKWAGEVLLRQAHREHGLAGNIYRPSMILAHRVYSGQINISDTFSRLLYSLIITGLAPRSFYAREACTAAADYHYDGLPVDFVAAAIAGIGAAPLTGLATYNVVNVHRDDGVSLDRIVDWVVSGGCPIRRVRNYAQWVEDVQDRLRMLPVSQRRLSLLPIRQAFQQPSRSRRPPDARRFEDAVSDLDIDAGIPGLTEDFLHKCLDDLGAIGLPRPVHHG